MADFQENLAELEQRNATVLAASVDSQEDAQELIDTLQLTYPVAYGLDHMTFAEQTGAFYETRRSIIHATGFLIGSNGQLVGSVYSASNIGRYRAIDCIRVIDFFNKQ
ncbi:peroxiredoxin family protein [Chloroflexi bacterium TSY]|nr:peroxiredoxin family protein [Chloroflexi bacterium TSY]